ncbi:MAG: radical SAM protein [Methanotrichaceae archaeon]|nr:radical SAM protein [Methanotrichaceae archaeon]
MASKALWQMRIKGRPFVLSHGINSRCNLSCKFCEYWSEPKQEMSTPAILKMLNEAREFGIGIYNAWTVEPLLRPDLPEILMHAKKLGLITSLITNGQLLRLRAHELLDLDYLSVSIDGIKSYRAIRGGDLHQVLEGLKAADKLGHEILINCIICGKNLNELEDLVKLAESLGTFISFEPINETGFVDKKVWQEMGLRDLHAYRQAVDKLVELKKGGAPIINSLTYLNMIKELKPEYKCHASEIILHVASDGTIQNCRLYKESMGNVSNGLLSVWMKSKEKRRRISCECNGCLFFGYVENSLLYEFVPEVMAHYKWM